MDESSTVLRPICTTTAGMTARRVVLTSSVPPDPAAGMTPKFSRGIACPPYSSPRSWDRLATPPVESPTNATRKPSEVMVCADDVPHHVNQLVPASYVTLHVVCESVSTTQAPAGM